MLDTKLLSKVLNGSCTFVEQKDNLISIILDDKTSHINIYELANKCKQFFLENNQCYIESMVSEGWALATLGYLKNGDFIQKVFSHKTSEAEAIFKACQFILELDTQK